MQLKLSYIQFLVSTPLLVLCLPLPYSSGSQGCWFYSGGGGCYGKMSAAGVLCWEKYEVHVDGFFFPYCRIHLGLF